MKLTNKKLKEAAQIASVMMAEEQDREDLPQHEFSPEFEARMQELLYGNKKLNLTVPAILLLIGVLIYMVGVYKVYRSQYYAYTEGTINAIYELDTAAKGTFNKRATVRYKVNDIEYIHELKEFRFHWKVGDAAEVYYDVRYPSEPIEDYDIRDNDLRMASFSKLIGIIFGFAALVTGIYQVRNWRDDRKDLRNAKGLKAEKKTLPEVLKSGLGKFIGQKSIAILAVSLCLIAAGIGLQFLAGDREKKAEEYVPVDATVTETLEQISTRGYTLFHFRASYEVDGVEYIADIRLPYIYWVEKGANYTVYYRDDPAVTVTADELEVIKKKAPVPRYIGWVLTAAGAAVLVFARKKDEMV